MLIKYRNNNATDCPVYMSGKCIEIKNWLTGESFTPFIKSVFVNNFENEEMTEHDIKWEANQHLIEDAEQAIQSYQESISEETQ